jgi:hypothetical protein
MRSEKRAIYGEMYSPVLYPAAVRTEASMAQDGAFAVGSGHMDKRSLSAVAAAMQKFLRLDSPGLRAQPAHTVDDSIASAGVMIQSRLGLLFFS